MLRAQLRSGVAHVGLALREPEEFTRRWHGGEVPYSWWVFLSLALAWAETLSAFDIFIGVNCVDYSGYPDCRPEFLESFEAVANLATRAGVLGQGRFRIHAPLMLLNKEQIIERGRALGVDYSLTHSCYDPTVSGLACGRCDACTIRRSAFDRLGLADPIPYEEAPGNGGDSHQ